MLTPEQKQIKIAELCGYEKQAREESWWFKALGHYYTINLLPDYLNDLNAMAEAEKSKKLNLGKYWENLSEIVTPSAKGFGKELGFCRAIQATASQRADAFLLTNGVTL